MNELEVGRTYETTVGAYYKGKAVYLGKSERGSQALSSNHLILFKIQENVRLVAFHENYTERKFYALWNDGSLKVDSFNVCKISSKQKSYLEERLKRAGL